MAPSVIALLCLILGQNDTAVEEAVKTEEFLFGEEVVVSAAKHEESVERSPSAVTVITAEDIARYRPQNLIEALRPVPGLFVQALSPSYTVVNIRRVPERTNHPVLFLIDGRKTTLDILGYSLIETLPVALEDIERIEVIRGPGSALYGSALNGIVNIITKDPVKYNGFHVRVSGGEFRSREAVLRASGTMGELRYGVTASSDMTDSREVYTRAKRSLRATGKVLYPISSSSTIDFQSGVDRTEAGGASDLGDVAFDLFQPFAYLGWETRRNGQELRAQLYYGRMEAILSLPFLELLKSSFGPVIGGRFTQTDFLHMPGTQNTYDGEITYSPFTDLFHNRLTMGANMRYVEASTPLAAQGSGRETISALYLQDEYSPLRSLTCLVGARYDYNSVSRPSFSPRVSVVLLPAEDHSIRASYGQSFRKPSFLENQFKIVGLSEKPLKPFLSTPVTFSNPSLKNQRNESYEIGYQLRLRRVRAHLDIFYSRIHDLITFNSASLQWDNFTETSYTYGAEAGAEWIIVPEIARVYGNYSFIEGTDIGGVPEPWPGSQRKVSAGASVSLPWRISLSSQIYYIGEWTTNIQEPSIVGMIKGYEKKIVPSYTLVNAGVSYAFLTPKVDIGLTIFNLLNEDARDYPRIGTFGGERLTRTIMAFVQGTF